MTETFSPFVAAGFTADSAMLQQHNEQALTSDMCATGPYQLLAFYRRGSVTLLFEQNTCAEPAGNGLTVIVSHPPVCIVTGPNGSATCSTSDPALILTLAGELS